MNKYDEFQRQSRRTALCGLLAALSVVILTLGSVIPLATFACPLLAMVCLLPVVQLYGAGASMLVYAAVSILGVLLCADKELAFFYLFLGWYPSLRPRLEPLPKPLRIAVKCGLFTAAIGTMYASLLFIFQMEAIVAEFAEYSRWMVIGLLAEGDVTLLLFDRLLGVLDASFRRKLRR